MNSRVQNTSLCSIDTVREDYVSAGRAIFSCSLGTTTSEEGIPAELTFTLCYALSMLKFVSRMCTVSVWKGHIYSINKQHVVCNMFHVCHKHGNSFTVNKAYSSVTLVPFIEDVTIELICLSKGQRRENEIL